MTEFDDNKDTSSLESQGEAAIEQDHDLEALVESDHLPTRQEIIDSFGPHSTIDEEMDWNVRFGEFCRNPDQLVYEFLNQEFIAALGSYLAGRVTTMQQATGDSIVILEVGAGNGRLSHFLQEVLEKLPISHVKVVATDPVHPHYQIEPQFPVEKLDYKSALLKYQPDIVISSWMPYGADWTPAMRQTDSVEEYILVGERDGGAVGSDETWGIHYETPQHDEEGFSRYDQEQISRTQICCNDCVDDLTNTPPRSHSATTSFRRD